MRQTAATLPTDARCPACGYQFHQDVLQRGPRVVVCPRCSKMYALPDELVPATARVAAQPTIEYVADWATDMDAVVAYDGSDEVGILTWYNVDHGEFRALGKIDEVWVGKPYQRQGLATAMLELARKSVPYEIRHSQSLTQDGAGWAQAVGSRSADISVWGRFWVKPDGSELEVTGDQDHADVAEDLGAKNNVELLNQGWLRIGVYTAGGGAEMYMESVVPATSAQIQTVTDLFKAYVGHDGTLALAVSRSSQGKNREAYIPKATLEVLLECLQGRVPITGMRKNATDDPYEIFDGIMATSYNWVPDPVTGDESWRECPHHGAICEDDGWHSWCEAHVDNEYDRCLHVNRYLPYDREAVAHRVLEATSHIFVAAWEDVLKKAVTLYNSGAAVIDEQDELVVKAKVRGEHDIYDVIIHFNSADDHSAMSWACGCEWGFWAWQRQYDYRGRPCSHALAAFMLSKAMNAQDLQTPVEFELSPTQLVRRRNQEQKQSLPEQVLQNAMLPMANPAKPVAPTTMPPPQVQEQVPAAIPTRTVRPV